MNWTKTDEAVASSASSVAMAMVIKAFGGEFRQLKVATSIKIVGTS